MFLERVGLAYREATGTLFLNLDDPNFGGLYTLDTSDGDATFIGPNGVPGIIGLAMLTCVADLNGDGTVGPADVAIILGNWGPVPPGNPIADLHKDGFVDSFDLAIILGNWGSCLEPL